MNGEFSTSKARKKYLSIMLEIEGRIQSIKDILNGNCRTTYLQTNIEFVALQLRQIFELIAFSSLVGHKQPYAAINTNISNLWRAKHILSKIENINPVFYPKPVIGVVNGKFKVVTGGYLTRKQLEKYYDLTSGFIHAENPFSYPKRSQKFYAKVPDIVKRIELLLDRHIVNFPSSESLYVFRVVENSTPLIRAYYLTK